MPEFHTNFSIDEQLDPGITLEGDYFESPDQNYLQFYVNHRDASGEEKSRWAIRNIGTAEMIIKGFGGYLTSGAEDPRANINFRDTPDPPHRKNIFFQLGFGRSDNWWRHSQHVWLPDGMEIRWREGDTKYIVLDSHVSGSGSTSLSGFMYAYPAGARGEPGGGGSRI